MNWSSVAEIFGVIAGIIAGIWVLSMALGKGLKERWLKDGEHTEVHKTISRDLDAAHDNIRNLFKRVSELEKKNDA